MKALFLAALIALAPRFAAAESHLQLGVDNGRTALSVSLDLSSPLAQRLVDVIKKSPLVKEVNNAYVPPGTIFQGSGFTLSLQQAQYGVAELRIEGTAGAGEGIEISGKFANIRSTAGGARNLHQALLQSASEFAVTKKHPGKISPQEGEVSVLETGTFGGQFLSCGYLYGSPQLTLCSIQL